MFTFWRYTIAFSAVFASSVIFFFLVKTSVYDVKISGSLPLKGIKDIPPTDTIIPNLFAQIPSSSPISSPTSSPASSPASSPTFSPTSSLPTSPLPKSTSSPKEPKQPKQPKQPSSQKSLNFQAISPQQCFDYAKNCRDVQCAFQGFNVICDNNGNGPTCTCGTGQPSSASSIQSSKVHLIFLTISIFVISFYQFC